MLQIDGGKLNKMAISLIVISTKIMIPHKIDKIPDFFKESHLHFFSFQQVIKEIHNFPSIQLKSLNFFPLQPMDKIQGFFFHKLTKCFVKHEKYFSTTFWLIYFFYCTSVNSKTYAPKWWVIPTTVRGIAFLKICPPYCCSPMISS